MYSGLRLASAASATALALSLAPTAAVAADSCASRSEVRTQVSQLVRSMRDDVSSRSARAATKRGLIEVVHTFRGEDADTAAERRALAEQISALAQQLKDADDVVERKALVLLIKSLREQRERGGFTAAERAELRSAVSALRNALVGQTDSRAEGRQVGQAVRALQAQFACSR